MSGPHDRWYFDGGALLMARTNCQRSPRKAPTRGKQAIQDGPLSFGALPGNIWTQVQSCLGCGGRSGPCPHPLWASRLCGPRLAYRTEISRPATKSSLRSELPNAVICSSGENCRPTGRSEKRRTTFTVAALNYPFNLWDFSRNRSFQRAVSRYPVSENPAGFTVRAAKSDLLGTSALCRI
jgi:hypothetical protein